jgi:hypothetical protein
VGATYRPCLPLPRETRLAGWPDALSHVLRALLTPHCASGGRLLTCKALAASYCIYYPSQLGFNATWRQSIAIGCKPPASVRSAKPAETLAAENG